VRGFEEVSYHMNTTITPTPLALFSGQVSVRTWNVLVRNGLTDLDVLRQALANGLKPGAIRNLGQVALLEIRLALDNLPETAEEPLPSTSPAPLAENASALSGRELTLILALAEAGLDHLDPGISMSEALATLGHLRQLAGEDEIGDLIPSAPPREPAPQPDWDDRPSTRPQPLTADVEGGRIILKDATGTPLRRSKSRGEEDELPYRPQQRPEPEPVDDEFEGYVIDPKPGWGGL
jgi:hypothetical protein